MIQLHQRFAVIGYREYDDGDMQFLETRLERGPNGKLLPKEIENVIGSEHAQNVEKSTRMMTNIGRDVIRIVTAASLEEDFVEVAKKRISDTEIDNDDDDEEYQPPSISGLSFLDESTFEPTEEESGEQDTSQAETLGRQRASNAALSLVRDLVDDGMQISQDEEFMNMSPHRLCRYTSHKTNPKNKRPAEEIFGAHTDTSFVTIVPVAAVSGFETTVDDDGRWIRPEYMARLAWEAERRSKGLDTELNENDITPPWHCRYVLVLPGEMMQLISRDYVQTCVHRVVAVTGGKSRLSAPVLLRCRPSAKLNVKRYFGGQNQDDDEGGESGTDCGVILRQADGMTMGDIHDALQG